MARFSDIDEVMLCFFENFLGWLGRASIQSSIDLDGINTEDFSTILLRQKQGQLTFANSSWSKNDYEFF